VAFVPSYDAFCKDVGALPATQTIVTCYKNGDDAIGKHSDKQNSIAKSTEEAVSIITVVKIGKCSRPFELFMGDETSPAWSEIVPPGAGIIMTLEANLATKHEVPPYCPEGGEVCGESGSFVFRSIVDLYPMEQVTSKVAASAHGREQYQKNKAARSAAAGESSGTSVTVRCSLNRPFTHTHPAAPRLRVPPGPSRLPLHHVRPHSCRWPNSLVAGFSQAAARRNTADTRQRQRQGDTGVTQLCECARTPR
jgi:hypothetical protein